MRARANDALWIGSAFGAALTVATVILYFRGATDKGIILALGVTARIGFLFFWPAYSAGALVALFGRAFQPLKKVSARVGFGVRRRPDGSPQPCRLAVRGRDRAGPRGVRIFWRRGDFRISSRDIFIRPVSSGARAPGMASPKLRGDELSGLRVLRRFHESTAVAQSQADAFLSPVHADGRGGAEFADDRISGSPCARPA